MQKILLLILFYLLSSLAVGAQDVLTYGQNDREVLINALHAVSEDEEVGLVGATWFVEHFPHPKESIRMMINLDMVGRGNAFFAATAEPWVDLLTGFEANNDRWVHRNMMTRTSPWVFSFRPRTDGAVFSNHRIPTIHFGTRGATTRTLYHVPEDTMEQIDIEIMRDVIRLLTMTVIDMGCE